jgi:prephenate dehydrogenase
MKIFIVGLGLMGASYAQKLHQIGHEVFGYDIDKDVMSKALEEGFISFESDLRKLMTVDVIILALYPNDNIEFIKTHQHLFNSGVLLTDISGIKKNSVPRIESLLRDDIKYISHHPMAGRAKKGFDGKDPNMFLNNQVIMIDSTRASLKDYELLENLIMSLGFKRLKKLNPKEHDEAIAYTSQLTHIIASALMDGFIEPYLGTTGDSFRDLTRIANINETLWTELYLNNKDALLKALNTFQEHFDLLKHSIEIEDFKTIEKVLKRSRLKREAFEKHS